MGYGGGAQLLLNKVLAGRQYKMTNAIVGCELQKGFDSHLSPCGQELVIFDTDQILPCYVVFYGAAGAGDLLHRAFGRIARPSGAGSAAAESDDYLPDDADDPYNDHWYNDVEVDVEDYDPVPVVLPSSPLASKVKTWKKPAKVKPGVARRKANRIPKRKKNVIVFN